MKKKIITGFILQLIGLLAYAQVDSQQSHRKLVEPPKITLK